MSCLAVLILTFVVNAEHHRALGSSALTGVYLMITIVFEIAKTRSYFLRAMQVLAALSTSSLALKLALLIAQEVPKRRDIIEKTLRNSIGKETVTGFWNRAFFIWLNPTLMFGFRNILFVDGLSDLGPGFSSKHLSERLNRNWKKGMPLS